MPFQSLKSFYQSVGSKFQSRGEVSEQARHSFQEGVLVLGVHGLVRVQLQ